MRGVLAAVVAALGAGLWAAPAHADDTVVVAGTSFPGTGTYLTYFGCTDLYHADTRGPQVRVTRDSAAPSGKRATTLDMPGEGTASGPVSLVESVGEATSSLAVKAGAGSRGVAYVWYVSSELSDGEVWAGRAVLTAAGTGWQRVDATAPTYQWTRLDAATGKVVARSGSATIDAFTDDHGDGPGYLLSGFGCDGAPFAVDGLQVGSAGAVTTFDLEGWDVATSITVSDETVAAGQEVEVRGRSEDAKGRAMGAPLQLEARPDGETEFLPVGEPVAAKPSGTVVTTVTPQVTTSYRWVFAETGYADGHQSPEVLVEVDPDAVDPGTDPNRPQTPEATDATSTSPSSGPGPSGGSSPSSPTSDPTSSPQGSTSPSSPSGGSTASGGTPSNGGSPSGGGTQAPAPVQPQPTEPNPEPPAPSEPDQTGLPVVTATPPPPEDPAAGTTTDPTTEP